MTKPSPLFSIIIPVRVVTPYLQETLKLLHQQTFKSYEVIVIDDQLSHTASPAAKRNLGAQKARGKYLSFIDDDSYPDKNWLKNIYHQTKLQPQTAAFCGPCLTPPGDSPLQKASGLIWSSLIGSGGAGTYRNSPSPPRFVDDYPSVNLTVKKTDFDSVNGFDTHHWPGEDTLFCLSLINRGKTIYYHPSIRVFHHRRPVLLPHLKQISRYALHRGNFARIYPQTSFRLGYLIPSFFCLYTLILIFYHPPWFLLPLLSYFILILATWLSFLFREKLLVSTLAALCIPPTHLYYGLLFLIGFFTPKIAFTPHKVHNNQYHGG